MCPLSGRKKGRKKCEPQQLGFTLLGPFLRPENGRKIGPALWPERGPGMESPCALLSLLQDMLPDVFRVRLPLSACLSFRVPRRGPCVHSWPCCMCPSSVSLVAWCLRCLQALVTMKIYSTLCPTLVCKPGRRPALQAPVCLGLRPECAERLGVHQRGSLARARHSA